MGIVEELKAKLLAPKAPPKAHIGLSSGLTLLNLAISGQPDVAFLQGHFYLFVGDSQSGKTWLLLQTMAEAARDPRFKKYRLIHDNPERGALMDVKRYFGQLESKLEPPGDGGHSKTLEDFYANVRAASKTGKPFLYGLDSEDALPPEVDLKPRKKDKDGNTAGSYYLDKAKKNSSELRVAHNLLDKHGSLLIMIKQTRDTIGFKARFNPKTRSGGRAPTFYASTELWFSVVGKIKRKILEKPRTIGSLLKIEVQKNRVAGKNRSVVIPFYPGSGFDEVGSMVNWMIEENYWRESKGVIDANSLGLHGSAEKITREIEQRGLEERLREEVVKAWNEIEDACTVVRKIRY